MQIFEILPLLQGRFKTLHRIKLLPWRGGLCRGHVALDGLWGGSLRLAPAPLIEHGVVDWSILQKNAPKKWSLYARMTRKSYYMVVDGKENQIFDPREESRL